MRINKVGIIAKKVGMSHVFTANGTQIPVTILNVEDCEILENKSIDGRNIVTVGAFNAKINKVRRPQQKYFEKIGAAPKLKVKEFVVDEFTDAFKPQSAINFSIFENVKAVDVRGKSTGKGFAGVMKRYGFHGGNASHGCSKAHRLAGSTGCRQDPGRHFKGSKMPGRMGNRNAVILNLDIVEIKGNTMLVKGSILGPKGSFVVVTEGRL